MYQRLPKLSKSHSFFLFGARGTGKTALLTQHFHSKEALWIDLLNPELANELSAYPNRLQDRIAPHAGKTPWVVIDEVQKVPVLLEIVHQQIAKGDFNFALTGSSARKLKRGAANLLAGRAFVFSLFPLTHRELAGDFNLHQCLTFGSLPGACNLTDPLDKRRYLKAYTNTYLKEEIIAEQIVRNLPPFRRFLDIVGTHTTEIINTSNIARDIDSDPKTVARYYEILEDTLLGFHLPSFDKSIRKQQKKAKKFYLFDVGVARTLSKRIDFDLVPKTFEYGQIFENFIVNEVYHALSYAEKEFKLSFLRVSEKQEIDLIIERGDAAPIACEIKATDRVDERHGHSLLTLGKDLKGARLRLISCDPIPKRFGEVLALPWREALTEIFETS